MQIASKDFTGARESLRKAIELNKKYAPARVALIELEIGQKNYDTALAMIGIIFL